MISSFIKEITKSGLTSLDVVMNNGRVYRYSGILELDDLLALYQEVLEGGDSVGRFFNQYIKGRYEAQELKEVYKVETDIDVSKALENLKAGRAILFGNKKKLDELLEALSVDYDIVINREGLLRAVEVGENFDRIILIGNMIKVCTPKDEFARKTVTIAALTLPVKTIVTSYNVSKDYYVYDVELKEKEDKQEQDLEHELEVAEHEKPERENGLSDKQLALQSLRMIQKHGGYSVDNLVEIVKDYIENNKQKKGETPFIIYKNIRKYKEKIMNKE